jgi:peptide chain release factor 1
MLRHADAIRERGAFQNEEVSMSFSESREVTIEIRAGEGGEDARVFAAELAAAYRRLADRKGWKARANPEPDTRAGNQAISLHVTGKGVASLLGEAGGHRVQRIPRNERRGRVQSSTVTVAVLPTGRVADGPCTRRAPSDFRLEWYSGTVGAGGQNHQKTQNCLRLVHVPTGTVRTAQSRSRENSHKDAMRAMEAELDRRASGAASAAENASRREQVGTGERSDKRRTVRFQEDAAIDHVTGRRMTAHEYMDGGMSKLW